MRIRALLAHTGDLLDGHLQHQRPGARAAMLGLERQREHVVLGEQPADIPRVLSGSVDLGSARRDLLLRQPPHEVAKLQRVRRDVVQIRMAKGVAHRRGTRMGSGWQSTKRLVDDEGRRPTDVASFDCGPGQAPPCAG
jgi:hypothetical protein